MLISLTLREFGPELDNSYSCKANSVPTKLILDDKELKDNYSIANPFNKVLSNIGFNSAIKVSHAHRSPLQCLKTPLIK